MTHPTANGKTKLLLVLAALIQGVFLILLGVGVDEIRSLHTACATQAEALATTRSELTDLKIKTRSIEDALDKIERWQAVEEGQSKELMPLVREMYRDWARVRRNPQ